MRTHRLSKSKIAAFEQCPKRLWLEVYRRDEALIDDGMQARFDTGHAVGELACTFYPDGIMIEADPDIRAAIDKTNELITLDPPRPLFEATFVHQDVLVRVDLMLPAEGGGWHVAEVKSSTKAKDYQTSDLATQIWVLEGNGIDVRSASIRHIDNQFVYQGDATYEGLLIDTSRLDAIEPEKNSRHEVVASALSVLDDDEPAIEMGDHCTTPFECGFRDYCGRGLKKPEYPVSDLPYGKQVAREWAEKGVVELAEVDPSALKREDHQRICHAVRSGEIFHDVDLAKTLTAEWKTPFSYLDFETISFAIPCWRGTRPYEQIPFQFSLHVDEGGLVHHEFLDVSGGDPRRGCAEALIDSMPNSGSIIAYNAGFERGCVKRLAEEFEDLSGQLTCIADRIVDLLPVARKSYYHRDQRGSWSIKHVLPTLPSGSGYEDLDVGDGAAAQQAYLSLIDETDEAKRSALEASLRKYCALDTIAMVRLHRFLLGKENWEV